MDEARHEQIVALGKEPISADHPVGDPIRYDETFEALQAQLDRIGSLTGEEPDWRVVVELASAILKSKSKDLLVMTYLTVGLFEQEGYAGLAAGLEAYREFLSAYWESCFPKVKPPHGRYNAVQYLADRIHPQVELKGGQCRKQPADSEKEAVHNCAAQSEELVKAVGEAFSAMPDSPNLLSLNRAFRALKEKVGPLQVEAPPAEAAPADGAAAPAAAPAATSGAAAGPAVPDSFTSATQASQAVVKVAKYLLTQDSKDARGYRLMRAVHFGALSDLPKDRLLPPPPPPRRQFFENAATGGDWPNLLTEAEGQFAVTPLWLDVQRYVAMALKGLGGAYAAAHAAVVFDTIAVARRLPGLFDLSFKDGSSFADGATKAWLEDIQGEFGGGGGGGGGSGDALATAVGEARKLLSAAKAPEAIARLSAEIDGSASRRQQFRAQLALAGFCLDMNKVSLAVSLLEGLEGLAERYQLQDWEPDLAAETYRQLYEALRKSKPKPTPEDLGRLANVFACLCRLNPAAALKLDAANK